RVGADGTVRHQPTARRCARAAAGDGRRPAQLRSVRLRAQRGPLMRRRLARAAAVVALLWLAGCPSAGRSRPAALAQPTRAVLPNGVVPIVQEPRAIHGVALQLWTRMG